MEPGTWTTKTTVKANDPKNSVSANYSEGTVDLNFHDGIELLFKCGMAPQVAMEFARQMMRAAFSLMPPEDVKVEKPKEGDA